MSLFLSTLSLRRATSRGLNRAEVIKISIHALLAESDRFGGWLIPHDRNFYPRSPCGERPPFEKFEGIMVTFLSTLSLRRATSSRCGWLEVIYYFYPRSPCGERLFRQNYECFQWIISIHALLAESDGSAWVQEFPELYISIHALLAESDTVMVGPLMYNLYFYPRSPCGERPSPKP